MPSPSIMPHLAKDMVKRITGKIPVMQNHLLQCDYCPDCIKRKIRAEKGVESDTKSNDNSSLSVLASSSQETGKCGSSSFSASVPKSKKQKSFTVIASKAVTLSPSLQVDFENQLLRACVSAGWSFNSLHDPEVRKLFKSFAPGAIVPDRKKLATTVLKREVVKIEGVIKEAVKGHYASNPLDLSGGN
jgi:hypothetical protein